MIQVLIDGVISGLLLALVAMSFSLVYLPTRVFHIALAGMLTITPYVAMSTLSSCGTWWIAAPLALLCALVLSSLCELLNHRRLERRQASYGSHIIASLGAYIVIVQTVALIWGNETKVLRTGIDSKLQVGSAVITGAQGISATVCLLLLAGVFCGLRYTSLGLKLRALADNPAEFALHGHNVFKYRLLAFSISGLLAGTAALLLAYDLGFDPHSGLPLLMLAVVAVIMGGRTSFVGPILGGLVLGVVRAQVVWHFSARWQDLFTFLLLAAFLYLRPYGLCGDKSRLEVSQ